MKKILNDVKFAGRRNDAVSESIGFVLIFSLVMTGIGLITLYGYPVLLEQQSNANVRNMERNMIVLQNDMKSLVYKNVPYKETSLQVTGGALAVYDYSRTGSYLNVMVDNGTIDGILGENGFHENHCGQLRYESDAGESIIALENGAVLTRMEFQVGSAMLAEPRWFNDSYPENTLVLTFLNITTKDPISRYGMGTVKMAVRGEPEYYQYRDDGGMKVEILYHSDSDDKYNFSKGWENYFKNSLKMMGSSPPYYFEDVKNLVIKRYNIEILSI